MFEETNLTFGSETFITAEMTHEDLGIKQRAKKWWADIKADKPEQRYISKVERRAFPRTMGYPPKPKLGKHGPWAPGETKPTRGKYYCH